MLRVSHALITLTLRYLLLLSLSSPTCFPLVRARPQDIYKSGPYSDTVLPLTSNLIPSLPLKSLAGSE
jgi:hypothetical protein